MNFTSDNETLLEDENVFVENYPKNNFTKLEAVWVTTAQIINNLLLLGSLGAAIFLIYIILRFERLRSKTNIFIFHYAVVCVVDYSIMPILFKLADCFIKTPNLNPQVRHCIAYNIYTSTTLLIFIFGSAIAAYWYLENWKSNWFKKIPRFQLYFTLLLYILYILKLCIYTSQCFVVEGDFAKYALYFTYCLSLIIITSLNILTYTITLTQKQVNTKYQLTVSSCIILCYLPAFIYAIIFSELALVPTFIHITTYFADFLASINVMLVVYLLGEKNKYFKSIYKRIFKRSVRRYNEDDLEETSDFDNLQNGGDSNHRTESGIGSAPIV